MSNIIDRTRVVVVKNSNFVKVPKNAIIRSVRAIKEGATVKWRQDGRRLELKEVYNGELELKFLLTEPSVIAAFYPFSPT